MYFTKEFRKAGMRRGRKLVVDGSLGLQTHYAMLAFAIQNPGCQDIRTLHFDPAPRKSTELQFGDDRIYSMASLSRSVDKIGPSRRKLSDGIFPDMPADLQKALHAMPFGYD